MVAASDGAAPLRRRISGPLPARWSCGFDCGRTVRHWRIRPGVPLLRPGGTVECRYGWSEGPALRAAAQPVENVVTETAGPGWGRGVSGPANHNGADACTGSSTPPPAPGRKQSYRSFSTGSVPADGTSPVATLRRPLRGERNPPSSAEVVRLCWRSKPHDLSTGRSPSLNG
jgi:hypothetical protein